MIKTAIRSIPGRRAVNEDRAEALSAGRWRGLVLSDGMGGHQAGDEAARLVVEGVRALLPRLPDDPVPFLLDEVPRLSRRIHEESLRDERRAGMGATLVLALTDGERFWVCHAGDSRAYRLSRGEIERLTDDHSAVEDSLRRGVITEAEAASNPYRNALVQCMGHAEDPRPDVYGPAPLAGGDVLLLCSDGLWNFVTEVELLEAAAGTRDPAAAAEHLVRKAYGNGSDDNVTAAILEKGAYPQSPNPLAPPPPVPRRTANPGRKRSAALAGTAVLLFGVLAALVGLLVIELGKPARGPALPGGGRTLAPPTPGKTPAATGSPGVTGDTLPAFPAGGAPGAGDRIYWKAPPKTGPGVAAPPGGGTGGPTGRKAAGTAPAPAPATPTPPAERPSAAAIEETPAKKPPEETPSRNSLEEIPSRPGGPPKPPPVPPPPPPARPKDPPEAPKGPKRGPEAAAFSRAFPPRLPCYNTFSETPTGERP